MQVIELNGIGSKSLRSSARPTPEPSTTEVVVRIRAVALNYRDIEIIDGKYHTTYPLPLVPMSDAAGEVISVGSAVTRVKIGDRVAATFWQGWTGGEELPGTAVPLGGPKDGVLAELVKFDQENLVHIPDNLTDEEASTLPCAGVTAWHSLMTLGLTKPGDVILVQGTGGVSLFAMQFALAAGARVIVTSSSEAKLERALSHGAHVGINYVKTQDWGSQAYLLTNGRGVDHVIEVGGPGSFNQSLAALRPGGRISMIGYLGGLQGQADVLEIFRKRAIVRGIPVGSRDSFERMNQAISVNRIKPLVDHVFSWQDAARAIDYLKSGDHFGKVVLKL